MKTDNQQIIELVKLITTTAENTFKDRCAAVYIMGSLARGGFSDIASDIDIGITLTGPLHKNDGNLIEKIQTNAINQHPSITNNVSIFWGTIETINGAVDAGRYPPFDRLDLIDHALLLAGTDCRARLIKPSQQELEIASAVFALGYLESDTRVHEFLHCEEISNQGAVYITKTILFPPRFIYLAETGQIAGNDVSYQYYIDNYKGTDAMLVQHGYQWRTTPLPDDLSKVTDLLNQGLIGLYNRFIDLYIDRMRGYGEHQLSDRLNEWKNKINNTSKYSTMSSA